MAHRLLIWSSVIAPRFRFALVFGAVLLAASPISASVARAVSFEEKVGAADAIVVGKFISSTSRWDPTGRWIVTDSTLEVAKALKGTPAPRLTVVTPGGTVDGIRQETIGVPTFEPGDERVVFVRESEVGPTVAFFDQGVYQVDRDSSGKVTVRAAPSRLVLVDQRTGKAATAEDAVPMSLEAFEGKIRAVADPKALEFQLHESARGTLKPVASADSFRDFAREHWKVLMLLGFGILLALVPLVLRSFR